MNALTMSHPPLDSPAIERLARRRAGAKLGWYIHALIYLVVNLGVLVAVHYGLRTRPWQILPALGWGLGLTLHGISVFFLASGSPLRERMVQRERDRLTAQQDAKRHQD